MVTTRKLKLHVIGDKAEQGRVYSFIRNGQECYSQMLNCCISRLYTETLNKTPKDELNEIMKQYSHTPDSKKGSAYYGVVEVEKFPKGTMTAGIALFVAKQKFTKALKDGLMFGKVSLPTFKKGVPLYVSKKEINFYHDDYETDELFYQALAEDRNVKLNIKYVNDIHFSVELGNLNKSTELRTVLQRAFVGDYEICDSSIAVVNKSIYLNISFNIPDKKGNELDENISVGVDLGIAIPAVCAVNSNEYSRQSIGSKEDFLRVRMRLQAQRRRLSSNLAMASGGHGRAKKMQAMSKYQKAERNFVKSYNHMVSKNVVDFALKNKAKYINMEDLTNFDNDHKNDMILRNWSFYELQQMITYKAQREGIEVRKVNPAYTSQTCSCCGQKGDRRTQSDFFCLNPECKMYDKKVNADFNAARNISMSTDFVEKKAKAKTKKEK